MNQTSDPDINFIFFSRLPHPQRGEVRVPLHPQRDRAQQVHQGGGGGGPGVVRHHGGREGRDGGRGLGVLSRRVLTAADLSNEGKCRHNVSHGANKT